MIMIKFFINKCSLKFTLKKHITLIYINQKEEKMLIVGIGMVVGLIVAIVFVKKTYPIESYYEMLILGLSGLNFGLLSGLILSMIVGAIASNFIDDATKWEETSRIELTSLENNSEINGTFFLGINNTNSKTVYYYKTNDGSYKLGIEFPDQNNITIHEDQKKNIGILINKRNIAYDKYIWYFIVTKTGYHNNITEFHIPPGTILRDFKL